MKRFARIWPLFVSFLLSFSPSLRAQNEKGPLRSVARITVFVRVANGSPAPAGFNVRLESEGGGIVDQQMTDSSGKVAFLPRALTAYTVSIREHGYRDVAQRVDISFTPTVAVSLTITPIPGQHDSDHLTADSAISVSNLAIPARAMKEFQSGQKLLEQKHDVSGSIAHFRRAIELYDSFTQAYVMLGLAYLKEQKLTDARPALERAIQLDPKSSVGYLALGACLNQQGDYAGAEKVLQQGLELNPESPEGQYELAKACWAQHRWADAEPHARNAERLQPLIPGVHVLLGNILLQQHDNQGAIKEFDEYLHLDPHGPMSESVRRLVQKLRNSTIE